MLAALALFVVSFVPPAVSCGIIRSTGINPPAAGGEVVSECRNY